MKKILIFTARAGFPNGSGASSILRKYQIGFNKLGYETTVLLLRPSEKKEKMINYLVKGQSQDGFFEYLCGTVVSPGSKIKRCLIYIKGVVHGVRYLVIKRKNISKVFFYSPDYLFSTRIITMTCKTFKLPCMAIKTESNNCDPQRVKRKNSEFIEKCLYKDFEKIFVVTRYLKKQLERYTKDIPIEVISILVDDQMYEGCEKKKEDKVIYLGSFTEGKRGEVEDFLEISIKFLRRLRNWRVIAVGGFEQKSMEIEIRNRIVDCDVGDRIEFVGQLAYKEMREYVCSGKIMILPRRDEEYSKAGFPIKLGEYLMTGVPTITTDVGELKEYLEDKKDVYFVETGNCDAFVDTLEYVVNHYEEAIQVAMQGKKTAIEKFACEAVCRKMFTGGGMT